MSLELKDLDRLRTQEYNKMLDKLGGKFSWWERWLMGGTGLGGLRLYHSEDLLLPDLHNESWICSFERLRKGLIFRCTNSKKWYISTFPFPSIRQINIPDSNRLLLHLTKPNTTLTFSFNEWSFDQVVDFFKSLDEVELNY